MPQITTASLVIHFSRTLIINAVTFAVALGLARNRRRNPPLLPLRWPPAMDAPRVQIIIPARDEERNLPALLESLLSQQYPQGRWGITVVDDASTDATGELTKRIARGEPRLTLIEAPPLPSGWTGKSHAMYAGARSVHPEVEWLLFVDADTRHAPQMLPTVVLRALESGADMLSLIIEVKMESFWERLLVPQVGELYTLLVGTMDEVNGPTRKAAANGQFLLVRRELLLSLIAQPDVHGDVAEDRALAQAAKDRGYRVRLEYGQKLVSARVYTSLRELWAGYSKTLFWASGHRLPRALAVAAALGLYALLPPGALLHALVRKNSAERRAALVAASLQIIPMLALRSKICRWLGIPAFYALTYPLSVAVGIALLLHSIYRVRSGKGVRWKGRTYTQGHDASCPYH